MADNEEELEQNKEEDLNLSNFDESSDIQNSKFYEFNVILIGDSGVGKTSIMAKFIDGNFENNKKCTINVEFKTKNLKIDKDLYAKLTIFDTAGQERYRAITKNYFKDSHGIILIYDITKRSTFEHIEKWLESIKETLSDWKRSGYMIMILGNKLDLVENNGKKRAVTSEEGKNICSKNDIYWGGE